MSAALKVLHVLGGLRRGGAETWLVQLAEELSRNGVRVDVAVLSDPTDHAYYATLRSLGCEIHHCGSASRPLRFARNLGRVLESDGPYRAVHCSLGLFGGYVAKVARRHGVPVRIVHSRNSADGKAGSLARSLYRAAMKQLIARNATHLLAVSTPAAEGTFGQRMARGSSCSLMTGFDFSAFRTPADRRELRASLGIPDGALVVGHVGSFTSQKNHEFLVEIGDSLRRLNKSVQVLLVGDGALRGEIECMVQDRGAGETFRFLGERSDVPELMMGVMDAFVLPSHFEGLPRVLVEAQAAGLPCVVSSEVTREAAALDDRVRFVSLQQAADHWAQAILEVLTLGQSPDASRAALQAFEERGLTIRANARRLEQLYSTGVAGDLPR